MHYESAHIEAHKKGYRGVLMYRDSLGKWRKRTKVLEANRKRAAERELDVWRAQMEREHEEAIALEAEAKAAGILAVKTGTVPQFVSQFIDRKEALGTNEPRTIHDYRGVCRRIASYLDGISAADLTPAQATEFVATMLRDGLAPRTVVKTYRLIKQAYSEAVALELLPRNPFAAVKPPKQRRQEHNDLDANARARMFEFLESVNQTPPVLAALIALYTGMRRAEVCGLMWQDIDQPSGLIHLARAIGTAEGENATYTKSTKTDRVRPIPIPDRLAAILDAERRRQAVAWAEAGAPFNMARRYVLTGTDSYYNPMTLSRKWGDLARLSGILGKEGRPPTFHDLRHTYATVGSNSGIDVKIMQTILGHASAAMTLDVYASADTDSIARAGRIMNESVRPAEVVQFPPTGTEG